MMGGALVCGCVRCRLGVVEVCVHCFVPLSSLNTLLFIFPRSLPPFSFSHMNTGLRSSIC